MDQPTRTDPATAFEHTHVTFDDGIALECGTTLRHHTVAYRTYGTLNAAKTNAIAIIAFMLVSLCSFRRI